MNIGELIEQLNKYPPGMKVVVTGYEGGYDDPDNLRLVEIEPKPDNKYWDGMYEATTSEGEKALVIPR